MLKTIFYMVWYCLMLVIAKKLQLQHLNYRFGKEGCDRLFQGGEHYDYIDDVYRLEDGAKCQYCQCDAYKLHGGCQRCKPARLSDLEPEIRALAENCYLSRPGEIPMWKLCCPNQKICRDDPLTRKFFNKTRLQEVKEKYKGYKMSLPSS